MQRKRICFIVAVVTLGTLVIYGQQKKLPQLPEFTTEQRWARAQAHVDVFFAAGVGYAKSLNHTADDFMQYCVKMIFPRFCGHTEKPLTWWPTPEGGKEIRNGRTEETKTI